MALTSVYVDISALEVRLKKFKLDRTGNDDTIQLGINAGDNFVTRKTKETTLPTPTPTEIVDAATLWAAKDILISLSTGNKEPPGAAIEYKQEAKDIMKEYLEAHPEEKESPDGRLIIGGVVE